MYIITSINQVFGVSRGASEQLLSSPVTGQQVPKLLSVSFQHPLTFSIGATILAMMYTIICALKCVSDVYNNMQFLMPLTGWRSGLRGFRRVVPYHGKVGTFNHLSYRFVEMSSTDSWAVCRCRWRIANESAHVLAR